MSVVYDFMPTEVKSGGHNFFFGHQEPFGAFVYVINSSLHTLAKHWDLVFPYGGR